MDILELSVNAAAVIVFAVLLYLLVLVIGSLPSRLRLLNAVTDCIQEMQRVMKSSESAGSRSVLVASVSEASFNGDAQMDPRTLVGNVVDCWRRGEHQLAAAEFGTWSQRLSMNWERRAGLASVATDFGMFFTVLGGIFAFNHIGAAEEPFAAFAALALAMLTTAAGLAIAITIRVFLIGVFEKRLRWTELLARELITQVVRLDAMNQFDRASECNRPVAVPALEARSSGVLMPDPPHQLLGPLTTSEPLLLEKLS